MNFCRSCRQPIRWAMTSNGKQIPLDPSPSPEGNLFVYQPNLSGPLLALGPKEAAGLGEPPPKGEWHVSHFAVCPNAAQHRRRS